ncbi:hypothetical protein P378_20320 [Desulforamulus profundi]|uniref:Uncharacterized protein n=1 Tax=Desulforamulus profundi TaxID=1383067 RepID=A0A2C6L1D3_9FIRM|nr:hypothetical protein P378_20320 [Desulforamulus profundi]
MPLKEKTYALTQEFVTRFKVLNVSILCRDLLGCDISNAEGLKKAREKKLFSILCPKFVQDTAEILEKII